MHVHRAASQSQSTRTDIGLLQFWRKGHEETGAVCPVPVHGRPQCISGGRTLRRRREKHPVLDIRRQHSLCILAQAVSRRQLRDRCPPRRAERQPGRPGHDPCLYQRRNRRPVRAQPGPGLRADCDRPPCSACRTRGPRCRTCAGRCGNASGNASSSATDASGCSGTRRTGGTCGRGAPETSCARRRRGPGTRTSSGSTARRGGTATPYANPGCSTGRSRSAASGACPDAGTGSTAGRGSPATITTTAGGQAGRAKSRPARYPPGNLVLEEQQRCSGPEHLFRQRGIGYRDRQSRPGRFHAGQAEHCQ